VIVARAIRIRQGLSYVYRHEPLSLRQAARSHLRAVWLSRDSHLDKVPGFVEFHLLKGPETEDHTLYASHTVWENRAVFEAWTKSEAFRAAHSRAGDNKPLYLGHQ
jgi:heme-degrading monooxygenase HmoA